MTECKINHQTKNNFVHDAKHAKKNIKRSIENNLYRNGCTVMSNDTFQMFPIPINEISNDYFRTSHPEVSCKKGYPENFAKFTGRHL